MRASQPAIAQDFRLVDCKHDRLRRALEEKEELLHGLRRTLRELASDRYPVLQERDELQRKVDEMRTSQARLMEERAALEVRGSGWLGGWVEECGPWLGWFLRCRASSCRHLNIHTHTPQTKDICGRVQDQLLRTADRCQELESYVRFIESQAKEGGQQHQHLAPAAANAASVTSPPRPPMVHDPRRQGAAAAAEAIIAEEEAEAEAERAQQQQQMVNDVLQASSPSMLEPTGVVCVAAAAAAAGRSEGEGNGGNGGSLLGWLLALFWDSDPYAGTVVVV